MSTERACPGGYALCGTPCGCNGDNPSHYPRERPDWRQRVHELAEQARRKRLRADYDADVSDQEPEEGESWWQR